MPKYSLCSACFINEGLRLDAERLGVDEDGACETCGSTSGRKLSLAAAEALAHRFFVWGSLHRTEYGSAPVIQFNQAQNTEIDDEPWLQPDVTRLGDALGVGFFYYGPRLWMVGEFEPLLALQDPATRDSVIERILEAYPSTKWSAGKRFYRVRINATLPGDPHQYDSPPDQHLGKGRLDSADLPVLYGSDDLQVCLHESRVAAEDDLYVATLRPNRKVRLLDLTAHNPGEGTEFQSLDLAVHFLFLAADHSYEITRAIAFATAQREYDGIIYPSYFSLLRTGAMPFETSWGISHRMFPELADREASKIVQNVALFGRPISEGWIEVDCVNRVVLTQVHYDVHFGPIV